MEVRFGFEAGYDFLRDLELHQLLDLDQAVFLFRADQRDRLALPAGPAGTSDPMDVVLRGMRQLEVDHPGQIVDVQAARGDIGGDQHPQAPRLEGLQRLGALDLALVAVNGVRRDAMAFEKMRQASAQDLGVHEDERLRVRVVAQQMREQIALQARRDRVHRVADRLGHHVASGDFDQLRILQHLIGELLDLLGECRGEQQALTGRRQQVQDAPDVRDEAHVQHPVRLVQHQDLDLTELYRFLLNVIQQASRCRDDDLDPLTQLVGLGAHVHAAIDADRAQRYVLAIGLNRLVHLHRQFAGRCENQRAHRVAGRARGGTRMARQSLDQRQREAGGLAGAGLRAAHDVEALQDDRDGLLLDRGRGGVTGFCNGTLQLGNQPEIGEAHRRLS